MSAFGVRADIGALGLLGWRRRRSLDPFYFDYLRHRLLANFLILNLLANQPEYCRSGPQKMNSATFVFMVATYWVGGSSSMEGGKLLANGQSYRKDEFIAAHRTLPLGTMLHVCLRRQCVSVVVKDRGPFLPKMDIERRIDLSYAAAKALDMLHDGRQRVRVSVPMPFPKPDIALATHEMKLSQ
jgi:rare lipoprotein A